MNIMENLEDNTKLDAVNANVQINEQVEFGDIAPNNSDPNIDSGDKNLLNKLFQQLKLSSLPRDIFSYIRMGSSSGGVFAMRTKENATDIEVIRQNISCSIHDPLKTSISQEAYQDIKFMYGENALESIAKMLRAETNTQENTDCIKFLQDNSTDEGTLTFEDGTEEKFYALNRKINECVLKANYESIRSFNNWAVVPYKVMAYVLGELTNVNGMPLGEQGTLKIARIGLTDFYLNPDISDENVYVGLKDLENPSKSSAFFGEYTSDVTSTIDPEDGSFKFYIYNRYGMAQNPLANGSKPMLFKFVAKL